MLLAKEYSLLTNQAPPKVASFEDLINSGLPADSVDNILSLLKIDREELAQLLNLSTRRIAQLRVVKKDGSEVQRLNKDASERALRVIKVFEDAIAYFGSQEKAQIWFSRPNISLGDKTPLEMCSTFTGMELVKHTIIKLQHGMTA
ncbi:antitoxin Xre/MbcA/ParS toxin-binding domain-containing protein [Ningiella sp. W23]|uniref:type II RES/Xre toxin-antitoxin system antitoxin n=1 Tax=Ningiella sp. W23 TaxID=3023715 RepID=UPI003757B99A